MVLHTITNKFITMDLETRTSRWSYDTLCCLVYMMDREKLSFYLEDYSNSDSMLESAIESLLRNQNIIKYKVYIHNFSNFDSIFILRVFIKYESLTIRPIIRDGRIIELKIV